MFTIPCKYTSLKKRKKTCERAALCTLKCASLTVEAAVILPVFLLAMVMFVSVIDICRVKVEAQARLTQEAKVLSMYACAAPDLAADGYIDLYRVESYDLPVKLFPYEAVNLAIRARVHAWTGRTQKAPVSSNLTMGQTEEMVYVTDRETVYHTHEECSHLTLTILKTDAASLYTLKNEDGKKYKPCKHCCTDKENEMENTYYVAQSGTSYHSSLQCGSLTRTTKLIKKSETMHLKECLRCLQLDAKEE